MKFPAAGEGIGVRSKGGSGFALVETLENIEKSRYARIAGNQD